MKKVIVSVLVCVMVTVGLFACSGSSSNNTPAPSLAMKGTSGNAVNMNGTWTKCRYKTTDQQDELQTVTLNGSAATFSGSVWSAVSTANCQQTATPDMLFAATITTTLGAEATATWTNGAGSTLPPSGISSTAKATTANLVFNSATVTPKNSNLVNYFNTNSVCGKTNWAVNIATDVLGCADIFGPITQTDYWVVDDSGAQLKWYGQEIGTTAYQVDSVNPFLK